MQYKEILATVKLLEQYRSRHDQDTNRLETRLSQLLALRKEYMDRLTGNNSDGNAHAQLEKTEQEITEVKDNLKALKQKSQAGIRSRKSRILQKQEEALRNLDQQLSSTQKEYTEIKNERIPETEILLQSLREQSLKCQESIQHIQKEIQAITALDLDAILEQSK
jgi:chromosome segregation ATPase